MTHLNGIKKKVSFKEVLPYLFAGLITVAVLLVIFAINGIYPFG